MKRLLKSYLFQNRLVLLVSKKRLFLFLLMYSSLGAQSQVVNYVCNGGFETTNVTAGFLQATYWGATDTTKLFGTILSRTATPSTVPLSSYTYQWPRHGNNYFGAKFYCTTCPNTKRTYPRNRLKKVLTQNATYCFKMYVNTTNQSTHGIDAIGVYFGDISLDTITRCNNAITYLTPQISNSLGNIISDTLNWVSIKGTFVANGSEKYLLIGNFKSDATTNKILVNPTNSPAIFADYLIDDVSLVEIDLPADAGIDRSILLGDSAFIGRQPDVGIDEACIWYKMTSPTTSVSIDTVAGLWVKPVITTTYVVKQHLWCSNSPKWDTVVVYMNFVGLNEQLKMITQQLRIYPVPAQDFVELKIANGEWLKDFHTLTIYNNLGVEVRMEEISLKNNALLIGTSELSNGVYYIRLKDVSGETINKRFVISR